MCWTGSRKLTTASLLGPDEDGPVEVSRPGGESDIILVCEHASLRLPAALGDLGLSETARQSHVAWDIGALAVARMLSETLDAALVAQTWSRLAYDCNRPPESPDAVPERSEIFDVPGNRGLDDAARRQRAEALYLPFHAEIESLLDVRQTQGRKPVLVTIHSFTPVYFGVERDGDLGILHDTDPRLAEAMLDAARAAGLENVRRNYPYSAADGVTHTLRRHGVPRGIPNVMLEIRNDLVTDATGQAEWARRIAGLLRTASQGMVVQQEGDHRHDRR